MKTLQNIKKDFKQNVDASRRHAEFISVSNQFAHNHEILKQVQDDVMRVKPKKTFKLFSLSPLHLGFTLAEVLITLAIIGVVAAWTIPTLINTYKETVFVNKAKKTYSTFLNAVNLYKVNNNVSDYLSLFDTSKTSTQVMRNLAIAFRNAKVCTTSGKDCGIQYTIKLQYPVNNGSGKNSNETMTFPRLLIGDGSYIQINQEKSCYIVRTSIKRDSNGNNIYDSNGNPVTSQWTDTRCARVSIDSNGVQLPNQYGVDVFQIGAYANKLVPWSSPYGGLAEVLKTSKLNYTKYTIGSDYVK